MIKSRHNSSNFAKKDIPEVYKTKAKRVTYGVRT